MNLVESLLLGIIQGITEFLPISSSGHLLIAQEIMNINFDGNLIEVSTHLGTLISVIIIFRNDIFQLIVGIQKKENIKYIISLIIGTLPSVIFGLGLKVYFSSLLENILVVSFALFFTGTFLILSKRIIHNSKKINYKTALIIGLSQALAIIPGISRSGITICTALFLGIDSRQAAKFSFFLAIPAIFGATILLFFDQNTYFQINLFSNFLLISFISSLLSGYLFLNILLKILQKGNFHFFGYYCLLVSIFSYFIYIN